MNTWVAGPHLAGVPGMPKHRRGVLIWGEKGLITKRERAFGKGYEYLVESLPAEAQAHFAAHGYPPSAITDSSSSAPIHGRALSPAVDSFTAAGPFYSAHAPVQVPAHHHQAPVEGAAPAMAAHPVHGAGQLRMAPPPPPREPAAIPLHEAPALAVSASTPEPDVAADPDAERRLALALAASIERPRKGGRSMDAARRMSHTDSADLWAWAEAQTAAKREQGAMRARLVGEVFDLIGAEALLRGEALERVGAAHGVPHGTLLRWYCEARRYARPDWPAALIPRNTGRPKGAETAEIPPDAWNWFFSQYMTRGGKTVAEVYRRLQEIAPEKGWALPSERTFNRRVDAIPLATRVFYREGKNALARLIPRQRRDNTVYGPGEAVNGDGLKFDRLWVRWPDTEVIATSTAWVWQDLRTGRLLAYRLAKTENTDLFRLATYDLLGVCLPRVAWMDNTTVAANLAMTAGARGRHRFGHARRADDPLGLLGQCGIEAHFTDPDQEHASPGSKRIERAFGIGGLHTEVAHSPRLCGHGFRKDDPVDYALFAAIVAEEVARFNARKGRRAPECAGIHSYDDLWRDLTARTPVRVAAESQRRLLLLMFERCRAAKETGEIRLKAGSSHLGAARFWADWMPEVGGQLVDVYFDPADLTKPVTVYATSGLRLGEATRLADAGHNDTGAAGEARKVRKRQQKAWKKEAQDAARIDALVAAEQYPVAAPAEIPAPGVVSAKFGGGRRVLPDGTLVDLETGEILAAAPTLDAAEAEARFAANVASLAAARSRAAAV